MLRTVCGTEEVCRKPAMSGRGKISWSGFALRSGQGDYYPHCTDKDTEAHNGVTYPHEEWSLGLNPVHVLLW